MNPESILNALRSGLTPFLGLVQMGLGEFDPARAVRGGSGFGERIHCSLKGQVDLAFDPGQRTQVEFVC